MNEINELDLQKAMSVLDSLMSKTDIKEVTADSAGGFDELPDGYYLCEVESAEFKVSKSSGNPMVAFQFKVTEDGIGDIIDEYGYNKKINLKGTANRKIFLYYVFSDEKSFKKFTSDMLKFEGSTPGVPLMSEEYFNSGAEILIEALDVLQGSRIYIQSSTTVSKKTNEPQVWKNLISWKRAAQLELPQ